MSKCMTGQDKEEDEDSLIDILKIVVEECISIYKKAQIKAPSSRTSKIQGISFVTEEEEEESSETLPCQLPPKEINLGSFTLPCTIGNLKLYAMANFGSWRVNVMPKSLFEHLKLADLKETSMEVEMADITKKAPLGIVGGDNISRPFLATIHAQIDVLRREILLGIGKAKNFNPFEIENDVFSYDSPACLLLDQGTHSYSEEIIDTIDSSHDMQELEGSKDDEWPTCNPDLSFYSGYDAIYGHEESGMLKKWICFRDHKAQMLGEEMGDDICKLPEIKLKAGRKRYALDEVWEKCEKFHDTTKLWYDKGFEE
ncbi:hypothetical protein Tco_0466181 [Tanacetum coccineum]